MVSHPCERTCTTLRRMVQFFSVGLPRQECAMNAGLFSTLKKPPGMYRGGVGGTGNHKVADVWMIEEYLPVRIIDGN